MALTDPRHVTRYPIPHEPGAWVEVRRMSAGALRIVTRTVAESGGDMVVASMVEQLSGWSYDAPITAETVDRLDPQTWIWLVNLLERHQAGRLSDDEKKDATSRWIDSSPESAMSTETSTTTT